MTDAHAPQDSGSGELASLFRRVSRLMARASHRRDHAHHAQAHVLAILREKGPLRQGELLEMLDVRSSSLSEVLAKLERGGHIVRSRDARDRRGFVVAAAAQEAGAAPEASGAARDDAAYLFACLDAKEREGLEAILRKLIASLEADPACRDEPSGAHGRGLGRHGDPAGRHGHGCFGEGRPLHGPRRGRKQES